MRKLYLLLLGFLLLFVSQAWAQRTIVGKVTDEKGVPIPNATVIIKGTTTGTTTKTDGTYSLLVPATGKILVFSSVDMKPIEVNLGANSTVNATLSVEDKALQEVVVTGYSSSRKNQFTGAATVLNSKVVENVPVGAFDQ